MTIFDFLAQACFWQWVGILILASLAAHGVANFRLWGHMTRNKTKTVNKTEISP